MYSDEQYHSAAWYSRLAMRAANPSRACVLFVSPIICDIFVLQFQTRRSVLSGGSRSTEGKAAEVKRNEQWHGHLLHDLVVSIDSPPGRHFDALEIAIVADVVGAAG